MTTTATGRVGVAVQCETCGKTKTPHGRDAGALAANSYCDTDCPGYNDDPIPGCLWPGETDEDFGYRSPDCLGASVPR